MAAIVLESSIGSQYEDSPVSYEFPSQYLKFFESAQVAGPLYVVLYEPRGDAGTGRMKYVGWAQVAGPPVPTGRSSRAGRPLYAVQYVAPAEPFDQPVPRELLGEPIESWLRRHPRGRARNVATFGRAVRPLVDEDFQRILEIGGAATVDAMRYPTRDEHQVPLTVARERVEVLISAMKRGSEFRRQVISAYGERCAVSGFGLGRVPVSKASGLLDAAHIRPVGSNGTDHVSNGLPLTPTLHRMFDAGLFTVRYREGRPEVLVSPRLESPMIETPDRNFRLDLRDGLPLLLPQDRAAWPNIDQARHHQRTIFLGDGGAGPE